MSVTPPRIFAAFSAVCVSISIMIGTSGQLWAAAPVPSPAPSAVVAPNGPSTSDNEIELDRVDDSTLHFKTSSGNGVPKALKTDLFDLKYLGALHSLAGDAAVQPYFLFTGHSCHNCLQDLQVLAVRPRGGRTSAFVYPGKIFDHKTRALVLESRAFYGRCLYRHAGSVYLVFQKERIDRRHGMQSSALIAEPGSDHLDERLLERHLPRLQDTLKLVKSKSCHEIEGRNRVAMSRPLDLNPRHAAEAEDDDDQDKNDEKDHDSAGESGGATGK